MGAEGLRLLIREEEIAHLRFIPPNYFPRSILVMIASNHVHDLVQEIGSSSELAEVYADESNLAWSFVFPDGLVLAMDLDEEEGRITFSAEVDEARADRSAQTLELLLRYNYLWHETGGVRMALDGEGGQVLMIYDFSAAELDLPKFVSVLESLADKARAWKQALASNGAPQAEVPESGDAQLMDFMRTALRA